MLLPYGAGYPAARQAGGGCGDYSRPRGPWGERQGKGELTGGGGGWGGGVNHTYVGVNHSHVVLVLAMWGLISHVVLILAMWGLITVMC